MGKGVSWVVSLSHIADPALRAQEPTGAHSARFAMSGWCPSWAALSVDLKILRQMGMTAVLREVNSRTEASRNRITGRTMTPAQDTKPARPAWSGPSRHPLASSGHPCMARADVACPRAAAPHSPLKVRN